MDAGVYPRSFFLEIFVPGRLYLRTVPVGISGRAACRCGIKAQRALLVPYLRHIVQQFAHVVLVLPQQVGLLVFVVGVQPVIYQHLHLQAEAEMLEVPRIT